MNFLGFEYLEPKFREPENLVDLPDFNQEAYKSEGMKKIESGDFDWATYLKQTIKQVEDNPYLR